MDHSDRKSIASDRHETDSSSAFVYLEAGALRLNGSASRIQEGGFC
jgi:hypothetical protein